jgi:hypothetical protein
VYYQPPVLSKTFITQFALDRFLLRVHPHMHRQVLLRREFLITVRTLERFLSGMDPPVVREATRRRQTFPTNITQISFWAFAVVPLKMALVLLLDVEHFVAHMTRILDFVSQHVLTEFTLSRYDLAAHVARNPRIVMVPLNVHEIRGLSHVVVNFPTDLTRVRDIRVFVELQVRSEFVVTFEA